MTLRTAIVGAAGDAGAGWPLLTRGSASEAIRALNLVPEAGAAAGPPSAPLVP